MHLVIIIWNSILNQTIFIVCAHLPRHFRHGLNIELQISNEVFVLIGVDLLVLCVFVRVFRPWW